jgi:nitrite transporter NirC
MAGGAGLTISSAGLVSGKLDKGIGSVFLLSVFCGVMMYLAIDNYNKNKNVVFIMFPVMIFILSGFEHSIANMFYFHLAGAYGGKALLYLLVMAVGNGVGAKVFDVFAPKA